MRHKLLDAKKKHRQKRDKPDRVHPFFFLQCSAFLVKIILFYTRIKNIYFFIHLLLRLDTRAQFTCSSNRIAEEQQDLNSLEKIPNDFLSW